MCFFSFQFSPLDLASDEIGDSDLVSRRDGQAKDVAGGDDGGAVLLPRGNGDRGAVAVVHQAVYCENGFAGFERRLSPLVKASDALRGAVVELETTTVHKDVTAVCHLFFPP